MTEPSWSERRRYVRNPDDNSTGDRLFEAIAACVCFAAIVGIVVWKVAG